MADRISRFAEEDPVTFLLTSGEGPSQPTSAPCVASP
jgi:hypothetical protein